MGYLAKIFGIGMLLGIALFFALAYFGWVDKFIARMDKRSPRH